MSKKDDYDVDDDFSGDIYNDELEEDVDSKDDASKSNKKKSKIKMPKFDDCTGNKDKALDMAISSIEKAFGKGAIMRLGDAKKITVAATPTGLLSLDVALGVGGIPKGRIIEVYGQESSGKTTLTLHMIAEVQRRGGMAAFIDAEHAFDPIYAKNLGVDTDNLYISQPDDGEQALEITETMVRSGAIDIIIVDSVAALVPRAEIEGEMGESHMGLHARLMSQALRKLTGFINRFNCTVVFINQLRSKIGGYGNPEVTTGGRALKFYASVRIEVKKTDVIKTGTELIGNRTSAKVVKNKVAPPFKSVEFDIMYGKGVSREGDILDLAASLNIINKSGSWYSYKEERLGQGREKAKQYLIDHKDMCLEVENTVRTHHGLPIDPIDFLQSSFEENEDSKDLKSNKKTSKKSSRKNDKSSKSDNTEMDDEKNELFGDDSTVIDEDVEIDDDDN